MGEPWNKMVRVAEEMMCWSNVFVVQINKVYCFEYETTIIFGILIKNMHFVPIFIGKGQIPKYGPNGNFNNFAKIMIFYPFYIILSL